MSRCVFVPPIDDRLSYCETGPSFDILRIRKSEAGDSSGNPDEKKILCYVIIATLVLSPFSVIAQEQAEAPTYKDGEIWQFKMVETGMAVQTNAAVERNFTVSFSAGRVTVRPASIQIRRMLAIEDEMQYLQFPLFVGKTWRTSYWAGGMVRWMVTMNVTRVEDVTTPAGTFRAFLIERRDKGFRSGGDAGRGDGRLSGRLSYTYYYSPQTRSIVKFYLATGVGGRGGSREIELIKFDNDP